MQTSLKQRPKSKGQRILTRIWQDRVLYLLLAPAMLYFVFFRLWPIWNMRLAFFNYKARSAWTWAGMKWFEIIFSSNGFFTILGNTMRISFMKYVLMFPFSVAFAILLNELRSSRMRRLVQVSTYLPHFLSWVVIAGIFINILSPTGGILNDFRALFGLWPSGAVPACFYSNLFGAEYGAIPAACAQALLKDYAPEKIWPIINYTSDESEVISTVGTDIANYTKSFAAQVMTGELELNDATWESFKNEIVKMQADKLVAAYESALTRIYGEGAEF